MGTKVNPPRYRIPDVCVTVGKPEGTIITEPPFLCIEIVSPDDSLTEYREKIREYRAMGVPYIWIVDPIELDGEVYTGEGSTAVPDGVFRAGGIEVNIREADV